MKKLLSILLCVALLATLTPSVFAADKCYQTLSGRTWEFSESTNVADYGYVGNNNNDSTVEFAANSGVNGQNDTALKIYRSEATSSNNVYVDFVHPSNTDPVTVSEFKVAFDFKVDNKKAMFKFVMRNDNDLTAAQWKEGQVKFLDQTVATYNADKWYHVEILFDIPHGYGHLKIKDCDTGAWTTYNKFAGTDKLNGWVTTCRLGIGMQDAEGTAYVDNYYQNTAAVPAPFLGSDDFKNGISEWKPGNLTDGLSASSAAHSYADDGVVLAIRAENTTAQKNGYVYKSIDGTVIANNDLDTNYHFKFKMGGDASNGSFGASLNTASGTVSNKELFIVKKVDSRLCFFGGINTVEGSNFITQSFGAWDTSALYDVEAVYNPSSGKITAVITNAAGKQLTFSNSSGLLSGLPKRFAFRNCAAESDGSVAYYDDFATDILDNNGPVIVSSDVLSGDKDCASLDETAVFTYDRTIKQAALAEAVVTLGGQTLSRDKYTITSKGTKVLVAVKGLEKGASYIVGLSGVKDILGNASAAENEATVSFKTSNVDITATQPVLNGTELSTNVTSYYAQGKSIKLIVAVYNEAETMIEAVKVATVTADDRNGETLSYNFGLGEDAILPAAPGKKVKGFVWSGFDSMTPYAAAYIN